MATLFLQARSGNKLEIAFGEELLVDAGRLGLKATGNDYREQEHIYESEKGFVILDVIVSIASRYGSTGYSSQLTARNANVEEIQKLTTMFEGYVRSASADGDDDRKQSLEWLLKQLSDSYYKYTSTNARLKVKAWGKARAVRIPLPWPADGISVDQKNASINLNIAVKVVRLPTPEDAATLEQFLKTTGEKKETFVAGYVEAPA